MTLSWTMNNFWRTTLLMTLALSLAACGGKKEVRLAGERISVLSFERSLEADPSLSDVRVSLPPPWVNKNWSQSGGGTTNVMHHLAVGDSLRRVWRADIGRGSSKYQRLVGAPVVLDGVVYTVDVRAEVKAFRSSNGSEIWSTRLQAEEHSKVGYGSTLAAQGERVFVATGYGFVSALDRGTGRELWRTRVGTPLRGGITVAEGRVYVLTQDNQLFAYSAEDGSYLWEYVAIVENAGILGGAGPAAQGDTIVAAFSSGELIAMRAANGQIAWQDALSRTGTMTALATLNDIDGQPVIDRGRVYAVSHSGRMVAIDLRSGERIWETNVGGIFTPWVAGDYIYLATINGEIVCLNLRDGRVRWVTALQRFEKPDSRKGLIRWSGPVLAGDRLIVASSHGYMLTLSPYTGEVLSGERIKGGTVITPIVADQTLYILTERGELLAYR